MRIQHNIPALSAYRNYSRNVSAVNKNLEKLSSGYKINRAGDDAAGLAISEKMRIQITGLEQAQNNAKSGINLVQTAEGAMTEIHDMLNRMYTLAEQSANGTYANDVDREQLQKEVVSLRTEINRIADATNYNGINLLDGTQAKAEGMEVNIAPPTTVAAQKAGDIGTFSADVNGKLTKGTEAQKYTAKFYVGDITNSNAAAKKIVLKYVDASGNEKDFELSIASKKSVTTEDIVNALKGTSGTAVGDITPTDKGTAASKDTTDGSVQNGQLKELYDISFEGNIITFTAKYTGGDGTDGDKGTVLDADADKFEIKSIVATDLDEADRTAATKKLEEKYDAATNTAIGYGTAAGQATKNQNAEDGVYQVASRKLTLTGTAADLHNKALQVGDKTYIIKDKAQELKGKPDGAVVVELDSDDATADVAEALAAAISREEGENGNYVATSDGGVLTISESTNRGQKVLDGDEQEGKFEDVAKLVDINTTEAGKTYSGSIKFDADKLKDGTILNANGKTYILSSKADQEVTSKQTLISYDKNATSEEIAKAVADQLTADGATGVTASGDSVTFAAARLGGDGVSATGRGLELQIGDTADEFNKMNVSIKNMHASSMRFTVDSLGENPTDLQRKVAAKGLSIANIDISTQEGASEAMAVIKNATNYVSDVRGDLGALQNRLDHTINNLSVTQENITDAESNIRDVDVAKEMMAYTKNNILVQSAQAMLAQANQLPQGVLQLLG